MTESKFNHETNETFIQLQKLTHENSRMLPKPDERDLWSDILNDVSTASTNKDKKCLLVLGDEFVGKTAIISRLRRLEGHGEKYALPAMFKQSALKMLMVAH